MIKVRNFCILSVRMLIPSMDEQCHKSCLHMVLSVLKKNFSLINIIQKTAIKIVMWDVNVG